MLAVLIGFMAGSARVLWPWPSDGGIGDPRLAPPVGDEAFLAAALAFGAFAVVWLLGLIDLRTGPRPPTPRGPSPATGRRGGAPDRGAPGTPPAGGVLLEGDVVDVGDAWDGPVAPRAAVFDAAAQTCWKPPSRGRPAPATLARWRPGR